MKIFRAILVLSVFCFSTIAFATCSVTTSGQIELKIDECSTLNPQKGSNSYRILPGWVHDLDPANKKKLLDVTSESLSKAIDKAIPGNFVGDIGFTVQKHAEENGFSVVRELVGHGIGSQLHEEPQIPNFGFEKQGYQLKSGMCIAIEPMINAGKKEVYTSDDGWTIYTVDGQPSAHFEHTIAITDNGPRILSVGSNG